MKKNTLFKALIPSLLFGLLLTGCNKDGPRGKQGEQGPQGEQGEPGQSGQDGTAVRTGSGVPSNVLGNNGDSYINLDNWDYYVKENGSWVLKGNIKGEDGDDGEDGKSAYQIAVEEGFTGTKEEWLESLTGKGISSAEIVNGELIIHYSDGTSVNLGSIVPEEDNAPLEFRRLMNNQYSVRATEYAFDLPELTIPSTYNGLPVTTIEPMGFYYLPNLVYVTIPSSIKTIGESAFKNCATLNNPTFPEGLVRIEASAFENCGQIYAIEIPSSVNFIGRYAFYGTGLIEANFKGSISSYKVKDPSSTTPLDVDYGNGSFGLYLIKFQESGKLVDYFEIDEGVVFTFSYYPENVADIFTKRAKFIVDYQEGAYSNTYGFYASIYLADIYLHA